MTGRPSDFTDEIAARICARLATGEPLVRMCREADMPDVSTVYRWLQAHASFRDMYARAREDQADTLADEIVDIADSAEDAAIGRLQVDARKWVAAKLKPRKYSDRVAHVGAEDGPPIDMNLTVRFVDPS